MNTAWDLADVQDWLGHKAITSTMVYAKITNKRRKNNFEIIIESDEIAHTNGRVAYYVQKKKFEDERRETFCKLGRDDVNKINLS